MKNPLLIILTVILSTHCYSQISFEKGYYIDNNEQKIECLIKNIDWKNNPTEFEYKLSEDSEQKKETIQYVKEFGVYNYSKYIRSTVNIDRSSENVEKLSTVRNPIFKEEILFLKVLVEGKSNLYQYEDVNLVRYFYRKDNTDNIEQLIYKSYKISETQIAENIGFKQQLLLNLKCENIKTEDIKNLKYHKDYLVKIFIKYNQCGTSEVINFAEKQKKDLFNLNLRLGLNSSSLAIHNLTNSGDIFIGNYGDVDFGNKIGFRIGTEAEFIFPFNKNKWAIIVEPTYQYFKSEKKLSTLNTKADYKSIELPIGVRHYFFINNNSKLFINASYILDFTNNSTIFYNSNTILEITKSTNLGFGIGYKQNDKYSIELRYLTNRALLQQYESYYSDYKTVSLIFGYSIF